MRDLRVTEERHVAPPEVAGEHEAPLFTHDVDVERDHRTPEHVPCVVVRQRHSLGDPLGPMVGDADHELERSNDVLLVIEGFDGLHVDAVLRDLAIDVGGILSLNLGRVFQHGRAQVPRGRRAVDRSAEALSV